MNAVERGSPILLGTGETLALRDAVAGDNEALIELTGACPMHGDISLRIDRSPNYFALCRIEGDQSRVGVVVDQHQELVGCVAVAPRLSYVNGAVKESVYVSDLRVRPRARGSGVADWLTQYASDAAAELGGPQTPVVCTILAGNSAMENRARGPRGTPVLSRFATLNVLAIPLLWERRERVSGAGLQIRRASERDLEAMALAWRTFAGTRQFADAHAGHAADLADWIERAPDLSLSDYLVAVDAGGRVRGFLGVWDQTAFRQLRVVSYSRRLAFTRHAINLVAPFAGAAPLPSPGAALHALSTIHVCATDQVTLRALLLETYRRYRGSHHSFFTIALDSRDPLIAATRGLFPQPTYVNAYVTTALGFADPARYSGKLVSLETALT